MFSKRIGLFLWKFYKMALSAKILPELYHLCCTRLPWWPRWLRICLQCREPGFDPWVGKIPWRREWWPSLGFLLSESHRQRSLVGYSPQGRKELDTTQRLHFHIKLVREYKTVKNNDNNNEIRIQAGMLRTSNFIPLFKKLEGNTAYSIYVD